MNEKIQDVQRCDYSGCDQRARWLREWMGDKPSHLCDEHRVTEAADMTADCMPDAEGVILTPADILVDDVRINQEASGGSVQASGTA